MFTLLTALAFHGLTTELPHAVWIALPRGAWKPRLGWTLEVTTMAPVLLVADVERHDVEGVEIGVFTPARTVVECFRHRSKVGLDVALAALRDHLRASRDGIDALWRCAERRHVAQVMRPYLEAAA